MVKATSEITSAQLNANVVGTWMKFGILTGAIMTLTLQQDCFFIEVAGYIEDQLYAPYDNFANYKL